MDKALLKAAMCAHFHDLPELVRGLRDSHHVMELFAHASEPTMHKTSAAKTATFKTASIMLPLH
jgi:hypothetical protein